MRLMFLHPLRVIWLALVILIGLVVSPSSRAETLPMFGVRLAAVNANFSGLNESTTSGYGITLGVTEVTYRVYADLNFYSWDSASTRTIHANYDYLWRAGETWRPFVGVYGGLVDLELDAAKNYQSGASAGVQGGVLLPLGKSGWQLETGLRFGGFDAKLTHPATQQEVKIKSQAEAFIVLSFSS